MTGNTDLHLFITDTLKKVGAWVRKRVSIWCDHHLPHAGATSPSHRPVECCPTALQWLCDVVGYWRQLEHTVLHVDPGHLKHARWVIVLLSMQAMEELGYFQLPGVV